MGEKATRKWEAVRILYEDWQVPVELLHQAINVSCRSIDNRALKDGWHRSNSLKHIGIHLIELVNNQLTNLNDRQSSLDEEKQARAVSVIAKTLDSIATLMAKSEGDAPQTLIKESGKRNEPNSDDGTNRTEELDRQLTALIKGLP